MKSSEKVWFSAKELEGLSGLPISDNPVYRPLKLNAEEANNLMIIGQVVRGYRDF